MAVLLHENKRKLVDVQTWGKLQLSDEEFSVLDSGLDYLTHELDFGAGAPFSKQEINETIVTSYGSKFSIIPAKIYSYFKGNPDPKITFDYYYEKMGQDPAVIKWHTPHEEIVG